MPLAATTSPSPGQSVRSWVRTTLVVSGSPQVSVAAAAGTPVSAAVAIQATVTAGAMKNRLEVLVFSPASTTPARAGAGHQQPGEPEAWCVAVLSQAWRTDHGLYRGWGVLAAGARPTDACPSAGPRCGNLHSGWPTWRPRPLPPPPRFSANCFRGCVGCHRPS